MNFAFDPSIIELQQHVEKLTDRVAALEAALRNARRGEDDDLQARFERIETTLLNQAAQLDHHARGLNMLMPRLP